MKRKRILEEVDYDAAKGTIVQLVLGGLGLDLPTGPGQDTRSPSTAKASLRSGKRKSPVRE
jgi:TetR/AcrR family transcriptional regulator